MNRRTSIRSLLGGSALMPAIVSDLLAGGEVGAIPGGPHFAPKAKNIIFVYLSGGFSHLDSFDPKPELAKAAAAGRKHGGKDLLPSGWEFKPRGESGIEISELFPHIAARADDLCLIRSMHGDHGNHFQATLGLHTGSVTVPRPSMGSWVSYGLGSENHNLPSFVVLAPRLPYAGGQVFGSDFLPGRHAGIRIAGRSLPNLRPLSSSESAQRLELGLLGRLNERHRLARDPDPQLAARIRSFETAFGMQMQMPEALDVQKESRATLDAYGIDPDRPNDFAWECLAARRLVERGVRFVEIIDTGSDKDWDAHVDMKTHGRLARNVDRPVAALLDDLKARGMFDDTLVVFTTEFGRSPTLTGKNGRGHHSACFSSWMAGAGVRRGHVHGQTDAFGAAVVEDGVHTHDFHATILHLLGVDHKRLTYRHGGMDYRLTDLAGNVVDGVLA